MPAIIEKSLDLYQHPSPDPSYSQENAHITLGDLHANTIKLLHCLLRFGVVQNLDASQYAQLVQLYKKPTEELTATDLAVFDSIISSMTCRTDMVIRLLGDDLCDRGSNDYFTLKLFEKLLQEGVPLEIIFSNHSAEMVLASETSTTFLPQTMAEEYTHSAHNLETLINKGLVERATIKQILDESYKPRIKLISYDLHHDNSEIVLYSHAPIGLETILALTTLFGLTYRADTSLQLAYTIDCINDAFTRLIELGDVHTIYSKELMDMVSSRQETLMYHPVAFCLWNRDYKELVRPEKKDGYSIWYAHGHDDAEEQPEHAQIICLDNTLGKSEEDHVGRSRALYLIPNMLDAPTLKAIVDPEPERTPVSAADACAAAGAGVPHEADSTATRLALPTLSGSGVTTMPGTGAAAAPLTASKSPLTGVASVPSALFHHPAAAAGGSSDEHGAAKGLSRQASRAQLPAI